MKKSTCAFQSKIYGTHVSKEIRISNTLRQQTQIYVELFNSAFDKSSYFLYRCVFSLNKAFDPSEI